MVKLDLEVLALMSLDPNNFEMVLNNLFEKFAADRNLLEHRLCCGGVLRVRSGSLLLPS